MGGRKGKSPLKEMREAYLSKSQLSQSKLHHIDSPNPVNWACIHRAVQRSLGNHQSLHTVVNKAGLKNSLGLLTAYTLQ